MLYQTLHGHPMTGGVISRPTPETFAFIEGNALLQAGRRPDPGRFPADPLPALEQLAAAGVGYLVLDKSQMDVAFWHQALPLAPVYEDDLVLVYATTGGQQMNTD